jgi:peptide/nickel transport system substrate-binding protein
MRRSTLVALFAAAALIMPVAACGQSGSTSGTATASPGTTNMPAEQATDVIATDPAASLGPAAAISGAQPGGTVTILRKNKISHLDPQRVYSFAGLMNAGLISRTLTGWVDQGNGKLTLVGDLATSTGANVKGDCTVWEFTIKDGLKFEDGTPITSKEIAYGIARSFDPDLTGGPTYLQEWLAGPDYDTAWDFKANKASLPPGLTTPDAKTVRFTFDKPRCDLPFALSLPASSPVPPDKDTGVDYDNRPVSSGPYMITDYTPGVQLVLGRNPNWDPATDPIRHQYPERFVWSFGSDVDAATNRIIADNGDDRTALAWDGVSAAMVSTTVNDPALQARSMQSATPSANRLTINTERVTDLKVRQALNYAINRQGLVQTLGGPTVAGPMTTIMPPSTIGFQAYDAYPAGATGDPAKAREVLAGATPNLVLAAGDDSSGQETAAQLKANLEQAGFTITVKTIPADDKLDETKKRDNPWDLWLDSWAADWPSGAAILPVLFDGRTIKDAGNSDSSLLNDDALNAEFDRIQALPPGQQASQWGPVDQQIMTDFAPAVPLYVDEAFFLHGSKVGGLFVSSVFGSPSFVNAYVIS